MLFVLKVQFCRPVIVVMGPDVNRKLPTRKRTGKGADVMRITILALEGKVEDLSDLGNAQFNAIIEISR